MPPSKSKPSSTPGRGSRSRGSDTSWEDESTASSESADERIRRLEMQIASGQHGAVGAKAGATTTGRAAPRRARHRSEKVLFAVFSVVLAAGAVGAAAVFLKGKRPGSAPAPTPPATTAVAAGASVIEGNPGAGAGASAGADAGDRRWVEAGDERGQRVVAFVNRFLAAEGAAAKKPMFRQTPLLDERLAEYADDPLMKGMDEQRFAERFFWGDRFVAVDVNIAGFGFRPIVLEQVDGGDGFLVDLDAFVAHVDHDWANLVDEVREKGAVDLRVFLMFDKLLRTDSPGDVVVQFRNPNFTTGHNALLSHISVKKQYIIGWLNARVPLPFVIRIVLDEDTSPDTLRVESLTPSSWFIPSGGDEGFEIVP